MPLLTDWCKPLGATPQNLKAPHLQYNGPLDNGPLSPVDILRETGGADLQ